MKYLLLASHATFAAGLEGALHMLLGERPFVLACGMEEGMTPQEFEAHVEETLAGVGPEDEVVLLGDIAGGARGNGHVPVDSARLESDFAHDGGRRVQKRTRVASVRGAAAINPLPLFQSVWLVGEGACNLIPSSYYELSKQRSVRRCHA